MKTKILEILAQVLECDVNTETSQLNCENWDSLKQLSLVVELESAFDVMFEPEEIERMKSYQEIVNVITNKV